MGGEGTRKGSNLNRAFEIDAAPRDYGEEEHRGSLLWQDRRTVLESS